MKRILILCNKASEGLEAKTVDQIARENKNNHCSYVYSWEEFTEQMRDLHSRDKQIHTIVIFGQEFARILR
jgi:hypothetical protein